MKELNIIEVSKIPNGKFEVYYPTGKKRRDIIRTDDMGNLKNHNGCIFSNAYYHDIIQAKFIQIQTSVSFMAAITSGKKIKCDVNHLMINTKTTEYLSQYHCIKDILSEGFKDITNIGIKTVITDGKWYVED